MNLKSPRLALILAIFAAFIGFPSPTFSKDQPYMEMALENLRAAAAPPPQRSPLEPPVEIDRVGLLKSAKAALQKAPAIYKGRRAKAMEFVNVALDQFKVGKDKDAILSITKAISEVRDGIRLGR